MMRAKIGLTSSPFVWLPWNHSEKQLQDSFNKIIERHFCLCGRDTSEHMLTLWGSVPGFASQFKLFLVELTINIVRAADGAL